MQDSRIWSLLCSKSRIVQSDILIADRRISGRSPLLAAKNCLTPPLLFFVEQRRLFARAKAERLLTHHRCHMLHYSNWARRTIQLPAIWRKHDENNFASNQYYLHEPEWLPAMHAVSTIISIIMRIERLSVPIACAAMTNGQCCLYHIAANEHGCVELAATEAKNAARVCGEAALASSLFNNAVTQKIQSIASLQNRHVLVISHPSYPSSHSSGRLPQAARLRSYAFSLHHTWPLGHRRSSGLEIAVVAE
jgi:hypothetical protein